MKTLVTSSELFWNVSGEVISIEKFSVLQEVLDTTFVSFLSTIATRTDLLVAYENACHFE